MKKIVMYIMSVLSLGFASCDLMDLKPLDQLSEEDVWNDAELLQIYVSRISLYGHDGNFFG